MTKSLVSEDELHMLYTKIEQMNRRITQLETQVTSLAIAQTHCSTPLELKQEVQVKPEKQLRREKWKYEATNVKFDPALKLTPKDLKEIIKVDGDRFEFIEQVKQKFMKWGCRGRIPYADRFDKEGRL